MSEIPAKQARDILNDRDDWNCDFWYMKKKEYLFKKITDASLNGEDQIVFDSAMWDNNDSKMNYLKSRLAALGYKVELGKGNYVMYVSW